MDRQRGISAVLDTSVLLGIHRRDLLIHALSEAYTIVWSDFIIAELQRKFREMGWGVEKSAALFTLIDDIAIKVDDQLITGGNYDEWLFDLDDHPIMATAIAGRVDYVVTSNTKDFPPKKRFANITVITPDAFLNLFKPQRT